MLSIDELKGARAIGYNIAKILDEKKMTAEDLAVRLCCPDIHVQAILKGSTELENEELDVIAEELGVSVSEILKEPDDDIMNYNIHYMGKAANPAEMNKLLDEVDFYVRLLNS